MAIPMLKLCASESKRRHLCIYIYIYIVEHLYSIMQVIHAFYSPIYAHIHTRFLVFSFSFSLSPSVVLSLSLFLSPAHSLIPYIMSSLLYARYNSLASITFHMLRCIKGRLKLCSRSLLLDPQDISLPILKVCVCVCVCVCV